MNSACYPGCRRKNAGGFTTRAFSLWFNYPTRSVHAGGAATRSNAAKRNIIILYGSRRRPHEFMRPVSMLEGSNRLRVTDLAASSARDLFEAGLNEAACC